MASKKMIMNTMDEMMAQMEGLKVSWAEEAKQEAREETEEAKKASDEAFAREAQRAK